jgi:hypothetical protein
VASLSAAKGSAPHRVRPAPGRVCVSRRAAAPALLLILLGILVLVALDGGTAGALWQGALYLLPALLLGAALLTRRYPGERLLETLRLRGAQHRARAHARTVRHATERLTPHGGRLIAVSLAGRAPPMPRAAVVSPY